MEYLLIGLLTLALYAIIASVIVYVIIWACATFGFPLPDMVQKLMWAIVLIIVLIGLVRLLLGIPGVRLL